ncbi:MAG TPA: hypothetical protein VKZ63_07970 [Kofleriaceae bacterium]|nr:hypothetical protein [Kofleriaceae bacterium]
MTGSFERERNRPAPTVPAPVHGEGGAGATSQSMPARTSARVLLGAALRLPLRFPGLIAALYLVQVLLSAGAALVMSMLMTPVLAHRPLFDAAMGGDLAALVTSFQGAPGLVPALFWIGAGAVVLYALLSWYLIAGLIAVLLDPPDRRREVARWFGAGGAANLFPLVRLALWSLIPYAVVALAAGTGTARLIDAAPSLLDRGDLALALLLGLGPALLLHWVVSTAVDYARVDLVRHPGLSSVRALLRGFRLLARRPLALLHTACHGLVFAGATAIYLLVSPHLTGSLIALVALRQFIALARFLSRAGVIAGQVELACSSMPTPVGKQK